MTPPDVVVVLTDQERAAPATVDGHLWKLVRTFDDGPIADEWELYDLTVDPFEARNRWDDAARTVLVARLDMLRRACCPPRHTPWPA